MLRIRPFAKRIAEYSCSDEHNEIKEVVAEAAREHKCGPEDIRLEGIEYPDDIEW